MENRTIIGLLGPAGSGKDLVADWFVETKNFVKIAFADPMKRFVMKAFGVGIDALWGPSELRNKVFDINEEWWCRAIGSFGAAAQEITQKVLTAETRIEGYLKLHFWLTDLRKKYPTQISTRLILQTLGTEWGRSVDPFMWARYAYDVIAELNTDADLSYVQTQGISRSHGTNYQGFIIPDHRFLNEIESTQQRGGYVVRLRRLSQEHAQEVGITGHQSEAEQKELPDAIFDHVMNFPEGVDKVYKILEEAYEQRLWIDTRKSRS